MKAMYALVVLIFSVFIYSNSFKVTFSNRNKKFCNHFSKTNNIKLFIFETKNKNRITFKLLRTRPNINLVIKMINIHKN